MNLSNFWDRSLQVAVYKVIFFSLSFVIKSIKAIDDLGRQVSRSIIEDLQFTTVFPALSVMGV